MDYLPWDYFLRLYSRKLRYTFGQLAEVLQYRNGRFPGITADAFQDRGLRYHLAQRGQHVCPIGNLCHFFSLNW